MKRLIFLTLLVLLSGCYDPLADVAAIGISELEVSTLTSPAEQPVVVIVSGRTELGNSPKPQYVFNDLNIGVCFTRTDEGSDESGGFCEPVTTPPPTGIELPDEASYQKSLGNFAVKAGQARDFSHTFTFTAREPATYQLRGFISSIGNESGEKIFIEGDPRTITFN